MKQGWKMMLSMAVITSLLGACSSGGTEGNSKNVEPAAGKDPVANKEPAEIVFYSNNGDPVESFDYRFGDALRKKFPTYTIKYILKTTGTNLPELLASNTRFDIFFQTIGNFENYAFGSELQFDMTDLIKKHNLDISAFEPSVIEAIKQTSGGKQYALPIFTTNMVLYYNKAIFDKFGVAYPKDGMTWDEISDLSKKLTRSEGGVDYYGFSHSPSHSVRMNQLSIPTADLKTNLPTINSDERWKTFFQKTFVEPTQSSGIMDYMKAKKAGPTMGMFVNEKNVAMINYVSSLVYVWEEQFKSMSWDFVSSPTLKEKPGVGSQSYPAYFGITRMAKDKDAAMEVLKYMVSEEFQSEMARKGIMPVLKSDNVKKELGKESPYKDKNWKAIFYNKFAPIPEQASYEATIAAVYQSYGTKVQIGELDMNTAMRQAEDEAKKKIEAALKQ